MSIAFYIKKNKLILDYSPEIQTEHFREDILNSKFVHLRKTFVVTKQLLCNQDENYCDSYCFCIGVIKGDYIKINSEVIRTMNDFYISKEIKLKTSMFVANRNISILRKIDAIIDNDFYIGGDWESFDGVSESVFEELIIKFPKTAEMDKYANNRIASILKEYFPECDKYEGIYNKFIKNKNKKNSPCYSARESVYNIQIELAQFTNAANQLKDMLASSESISEKVWQEKIHYILQFLYPKYILCAREISFEGIDGYKKIPDFILVDTNGFVDILEIKKPEIRILTKQASYRNNYVPVRDFSGVIQQIEKYIFCLSTIEKSQKKVLLKLKPLLPEGVEPQILNPQGILLLGRSNEFNEQQRRDFELIKRQYKNIADIITYDDLTTRLNNIINSLKLKLPIPINSTET